MKILLSTVAALSLLGGSAAMAQSYGHDQQRGYNQGASDQRAADQNANDRRADDRRDNDRRDNDRRGWRHARGHHYGQSHQWVRGERLPPQYYSNRGYYVDYRAHHLRHPPYGYRWVQVDNNYVLVAAASGLIAQIISQR
jgi:Ni/Co efflux regulator RcnB